MSRFRDAGDESGADEGIDISPLIDIVFILLIFFIVATTFVEETGVEVDKPQAASAKQLDKNSILIAVTREGNVVFGGQDIGVSGVRPLVERMLRKESMPVIIQSDKDATSGQLVRVIDEVKRAGAETVSIATRQSGG